MRVGLQVYTVRNSFGKNQMGTLDKIADAGYKYIEMANGFAATDDGTGFQTNLAQFKAKLKERGLTLLGSHVSQMEGNELAVVSYDRWNRIAEWYAEADAKYLAPALEFHLSRDDLLKNCDRYTQISEICKKHGLKMLYHNHFYELQEFDGKSMFDIILENTPADNFLLEVDTFWVMRGLVDPGQFIRKYGDRIEVIHQKDYTLETVNDLNVWNFVDRNSSVDAVAFFKTVPNPEQCTEIGDGMMKIQDIINAGNEKKIPYILVEQDHSQLDDISSIKKSMAAFKRMTGLAWD